MEQRIRDILERPFPSEFTRTRKGSFGQQLRYVEVVHYIRRLNEAFGGGWAFDVVEHRILDAEVVVLGKLAAGEVGKTAFGGSAITTNRESGEQVSVADDLKAAASDSLKKCCSLLGIGLELYSDMPAEIPDERANSQPKPAGQPPGSGPGNGNGKVLTNRQYKAILTMAAQAEIDEPRLKTWVLNSYGCPLDKLDRKGASEIISELQNKLNGNGRLAGGGAA